MSTAIIYCDGSYSQKLKKGGYGVVALFNGTKEFYEASSEATSSTRAELLGVIRAIEVYGPKCSRLKIYTDSKQIVDVSMIHIHNWIMNKWSKNIINKDLWLNIYNLMKRYLIEWYWIKSHTNNEYNDRADYLARLSIGVSSDNTFK